MARARVRPKVHSETMGASFPQARVVRKGSQLFAPPPAPRDSDTDSLGERLREFAAVAIGMWPLTGVALLALGLLVLAGMNAAP